MFIFFSWSLKLLDVLPHKSVERCSLMFIVRNILGVFKLDCIDFYQKNIVQVDIDLRCISLLFKSLFMLNLGKNLTDRLILPFFSWKGKHNFFFLGPIVMVKYGGVHVFTLIRKSLSFTGLNRKRLHHSAIWQHNLERTLETQGRKYRRTHNGNNKNWRWRKELWWEFYNKKNGTKWKVWNNFLQPAKKQKQFSVKIKKVILIHLSYGSLSSSSLWFGD